MQVTPSCICSATLSISCFSLDVCLSCDGLFGAFQHGHDVAVEHIYSCAWASRFGEFLKCFQCLSKNIR